MGTESAMSNTIIINGAIYVKEKTSEKKYISICTLCSAFDRCDEPDKDRRITCPDSTHKKHVSE